MGKNNKTAQKIEPQIALQPVSYGHLDILDGFRAVAIIIVIWFHTWQQSWLSATVKVFGKSFNFDYISSSGFVGVELFFVISGLCLFYPFAKSMFGENKKPDWKRFYYRRFIKIVPSYFLMLIIIASIYPPSGNFLQQLWYLLRNFFFVNSWFKDTFYSQLNSVLWSLSVEVQFYAVFPIFCLLMMRFPVSTFVGTTIAGVAYRYYILNYMKNDLSFMFNQLPGCIDLFIGGMFSAYLIVLMHKKIKVTTIHRILFTLISIAGFIGFFYMMKWCDYTRGGTGVQVWQTTTRQYLNWVMMTMLVSGCFAYTAWVKIIANPIFIFMSTISYNLYLWHHWLEVKMKHKWHFPYTSHKEPHITDNAWQVQYTIYVWVISLAVATLVTYLFERPLLKHGFKGIYNIILNKFSQNKPTQTKSL